MELMDFSPVEDLQFPETWSSFEYVRKLCRRVDEYLFPDPLSSLSSFDYVNVKTLNSAYCNAHSIKMALLNSRIDVAEILLSYDENFFSSVTDEVRDVYFLVLSDYQLSKFREYDAVSEILLFMLRHGADLWTEAVGFLAFQRLIFQRRIMISLICKDVALFSRRRSVFQLTWLKLSFRTMLHPLPLQRKTMCLHLDHGHFFTSPLSTTVLKLQTLLLEKGADPHQVTERGGQTALMLASSRGHSEMTSLLLCAMRDGPQHHKKFLK